MFDRNGKGLGILGIMHTGDFKAKPIKKIFNVLRNMTSIVLENSIVQDELSLRSALKDSLIEYITEQNNSPSLELYIQNLERHIRLISNDKPSSIDKFVVIDDVIYANNKPFSKPSFTHNISEFEIVDSSHPKNENQIRAFLSEGGRYSRIENAVYIAEENIDYNIVIVRVTNPDTMLMDHLEIYLKAILPQYGRLTVEMKKKKEFANMFNAIGELLDKREDTLGGHIKNVSKVSLYVASLLPDFPVDLDYFTIACNMHDIGKLFINHVQENPLFKEIQCMS